MQFEEDIILTSNNNKKVDLVYANTANSDIRLGDIMLSEQYNEAEFASQLDAINKTIECLTTTDFDSKLDYDIFAFIFVNLSRYEEYLNQPLDEHGRYSSANSILKHHLSIPLVDYALIYIQQYLFRKSGRQMTLIQLTQEQVTFDIDHAWKYKNKGILRSIGGLVKSCLRLDISDASNRIKVLFGFESDPFDLYYWFSKYEFDEVLIFFLLSKHRNYDKGIAPTNTQFQSIVKSVNKSNRIGIHPGYRTYDNLKVLSNQIDQYYSIVGTKPSLSRQHYLRLKLPGTYHQLLASESIRFDYSMGYADRVGFRAGTCRDFHWFDLSNNKKTALMIRPFQVMDVTLKYYLKLTPKEAIACINGLRKQVEKVKGTLRVIWHNSSPPWDTNWQSYGKVLNTLLKSKNET